MINNPKILRHIIFVVLVVLSAAVMAVENEADVPSATKTESPASNSFFSLHQSDSSLDTKRHFGFETNIFRILSWNDREKTFSGTLSFFDHKNNFEYAIPMLVADGETADGRTYREAMLDISIRKFVASPMAGLYVAVFARSEYHKGQLIFPGDREPSAHIFGQGVRMGLGASIGFRVFSKDGIYWGSSFSRGKYLFGDLRNYWREGMWSENYLRKEYEILEIEILKFGYAF